MKCNLCPRGCGALREEGQKGYCGADGKVRIARIAPHYWEEPCISGTKGSGTVFFCGCNLGCIFCQNGQISRGGVGKEYTVPALAEAMTRLQSEGVHNINLVTPTHYIPQIAEALDRAKLNIPVVYNTGGYESVQSLKMLRDKVQIYLPDYKYHSAELSAQYSNAPDYSAVALEAIEYMLNTTGDNRFDDEGIMTKGVIIRHLVLPGCADDSMKAIKDLRDRFGKGITVSIMNQYTPMKNMPAPLDRAVTDDEYELVLDYADFLGLKKGYRQEGGAVGESFIPPFETAEESAASRTK